MNWHYAYTPYIWPMLASAVFLSALGIYAWCRRTVSGALPFAVMLLFTMLWSLGAALELAAMDLETKIFWFKFQGVMKLPAASAELCFGLQYAGLGRFLTRRNIALLSLPPLLVFILALTNDAHLLLWLDFRFDGVLRPLRSDLTFSIGGYSFVLAAVMFVLLVRLFVRSPQHRWPVALILVELLIARTAVLLDFIGMNPFAPMDPVVLVWNIGAPIYALALFGFRMFDPLPLARKTVIEQMQAGMLVLDLEGRVISLNPAAERILNAPAKQVKGKLVKELLPAYPEKNLADSGETEIELGIGEGPSLRYYMLRVWPLNDFRGLTVGLMLLLTDVTEQKRAQVLLMEQQRALAMLQERDKVARELHDELAQGLAFINLQVQATGEQLAAGDIQQVSAHLARLAEVAREAHADVREQISGLSLGILPGDGFLGAVRGFLEAFRRTYGIQADLILPDNQPVMTLEPTAEVQLLRIIQEAFTNIRKHACAQRAQVSLAATPAGIEVIVSDDGNGFDPRGRADSSGTFGLRFMEERASEIGGSLWVESEAGRGTRVIVQIPR